MSQDEASRRFEELLKRLAQVPKREADQQEAKYQKDRENERQRPAKPKRR